jgi:hypothetical protein
VLPLLSISMGKGTGVVRRARGRRGRPGREARPLTCAARRARAAQVTSVPSDAPDDYIALKELQARERGRAARCLLESSDALGEDPRATQAAATKDRRWVWHALATGQADPPSWRALYCCRTSPTSGPSSGSPTTWCSRSR